MRLLLNLIIKGTFCISLDYLLFTFYRARGCLQLSMIVKVKPKGNESVNQASLLIPISVHPPIYNILLVLYSIHVQYIHTKSDVYYCCTVPEGGGQTFTYSLMAYAKCLLYQRK